MVRWVPIPRRHDNVEAAGELADRTGDLVAPRNLERASGREVVLEVDDQKRLGNRASNLLLARSVTILLRWM
jgi:hypothetical protein